MAYFPRQGSRKMVVVREQSDFLPSHANPQVVRVVKKAQKNHAEPRPLPVIDLTLFGGSLGHRRFYRPEKESVPEFTSRMEDQWHSAGDNIVLKIGYKGQPEPVVQWFKGEQPLHESRRMVITADGAYSELALFDAQPSDGGFYNCRIENAMGVCERGCHVFIQEGGPSGTAGSGALRAYRSVLYTPRQGYSRY